VIIFILVLVCLTFAHTASAQDDANPLATLNAELVATLADAGVPFSEEQAKAVTLMMEERRRASEELFGNLMDFRGGPTQGEDADRLKSAIEWMRSEFLSRLAEYLTKAQAQVWAAHRQGGPGPPSAGLSPATDAEPDAPSETQYVRINSNGFTAEDSGYSISGSGTEVIQRGGAGAWHGNAQFLLKDDALNARNAFASNKPSYQERRLSTDVSGPAIPGRLTSSFSFNQRESENVGTVRATLADGSIFALGITRPDTSRNFQTTQTLQVAEAQSVRVSARVAREAAKDQGIGGFSLPERGFLDNYHQETYGARHFALLSARHLFEARVQVNAQQDETTPYHEALRINVLDAFNAGGAQNRGIQRNRTIDFGTLYTRVGDTVTLKAGVEGVHRFESSESTSNFGGTYTFSSLESYRAGTPLTYRVTRGTPLVETPQLEMAGFLQNDIKVTPRLTLMLGARYEAQQNLDDHNNVAPRVAIAYSPSTATVVRAAAGVFYNRLTSGTVQNQRRFDGTRQYEIVIDNPTYPDPFAGGTVRSTLASVRVTDPGLVAPMFMASMISLQRTFPSNLLVTATLDSQREYHKLRTRNLNAPYDATASGRRSCRPSTPFDACVKPDPSAGNITSLESTGNDRRLTLRLGVSKRFSLLNASVNYQYRRQRGDVAGGEGTALTDSYDPQADWGNSSNPRHNVNATINARLPLGLFLTGALSFNSGRYYTMTTGRDDNRDSNINDRPAGIEPNSLHGPRYLNVDLNVSKAFFLTRAEGATSGMNANVFVNATNVFNRVHYGTPSGVLTSPNFGRSTSASNPRQVEAGVRFQF
jgi:hypothetical protein